jgi:hypothetical protein
MKPGRGRGQMIFHQGYGTFLQTKKKGWFQEEFTEVTQNMAFRNLSLGLTLLKPPLELILGNG